jgi:hypothetical protein
MERILLQIDHDVQRHVRASPSADHLGAAILIVAATRSVSVLTIDRFAVDPLGTSFQHPACGLVHDLALHGPLNGDPCTDR